MSGATWALLLRWPVLLTRSDGYSNAALKIFSSVTPANISIIKFRNGRDLKTISSKESVEKILVFLQSIDYEKIDKEPENGWVYLIQMYDQTAKTAKDENRISISFLPTVIVFQDECYECNEDIFNRVVSLFDSMEDESVK